MTLEEIIKKKLSATRNGCDFKKAWIPKGFTCIKITKFAKELAKELSKILIILVILICGCNLTYAEIEITDKKEAFGITLYEYYVKGDLVQANGFITKDAYLYKERKTLTEINQEISKAQTKIDELNEVKTKGAIFIK